ncbi:MAG: HAD-IIA family hydrolase [Lachnospiraceae bacterium]|nr:HAD-IIA family hydrolase [Lachnospiraceae bacterium]
MNNLSLKKLFLFDIDGTIAVGNDLLDGTVELLKYIEEVGGKAYYITNNSTKSNNDYVEKFRHAFSLETTEDLFITSGYMMLQFLLKNYPQDKIFVLGTASFIAELRKNGLHIVETAEENITCVVVAYDSELNYDKLIEVCKVLSTTEVPFYATNPDLCCPIDFGFIPDCGAICEMITHSTGKEPVYLGKPSAEVVRVCQESSGFNAEETLVVGDRLYTDIACGINAGVDTCVVYTGEARAEDLTDTPYLPTYCFQDVRALLKAILS